MALWEGGTRKNIRHLIPDARLIAIADNDVERARQVAAELEIEHHYNSVDALVERKDIQAVAVVTPAKFHGTAIKACSRAGKDIFCEKPLTLTVEEADEVLSVTARAGVRLQPGHVRRYDPSHVRAKKRIEAGEIGDPVIFKSLARDTAPPQVSYMQSGVNGMFLQYSTVHEFDLGRWMMSDEIAEHHAYGAVLVFPEAAQFNDIDTALVNMKFSRGSLGAVENYMQSSYGYDIRTEIVGSKGTIMLGYLQQTPEVILTASGARTDVVDHFLVRFADGYLDEMRDFVRSILVDRDLKVDGFDGRQAVAAAAAAERSWREGRPVTVQNIARPAKA